MRVDESSNSHSRLAWNSHALSSTLVRSRRLWTCSNFPLESMRVFSRLARVDDSRWESSLINPHPRLARALVVILLCFVFRSRKEQSTIRHERSNILTCIRRFRLSTYQNNKFVRLAFLRTIFEDNSLKEEGIIPVFCFSRIFFFENGGQTRPLWRARFLSCVLRVQTSIKVVSAIFYQIFNRKYRKYLFKPRRTIQFLKWNWIVWCTVLKTLHCHN